MAFRARKLGSRSAALYSTINHIERKIRTLPLEKFVLFDRKTGNTIFESTGFVDGVQFSDSDAALLKMMGDEKNTIFTHNHPSSVLSEKGTPGIIATSFSGDDISFGAYINVSELRAVSADGSVYIMKRPKNGWPKADIITSARKQANSETYSENWFKINSKQLRPEVADRIHPDMVTARFIEILKDMFKSDDFVPQYYKEELSPAYQRK
jgi:hypothetical protein